MARSSGRSREGHGPKESGKGARLPPTGLIQPIVQLLQVGLQVHQPATKPPTLEEGSGESRITGKQAQPRAHKEVRKIEVP
jgi:hypothetical protein